ncbi:MAG TPA: M48 family metalloprotease [Longimicrobiales bacterium]
MRRFGCFRYVPMAALALAAAGCAVNPATGERELMLVSEAQEIQMGREADAQIVAQMGLYPDSALQAYVQRLGRELASRSERPDLPWTFRVVDDPVVNAFALPGGFIYVTRGILAHLGSEAELAAVIGHEIGHVTARHSASQMSRAMLAQLGVGAAAAFIPEVSDYAGLANAGLGLLFLKYGREDESQADELGLRYMTAANYDPREMPGVFEMLGRVSQAAGGGRVPEWLSTHPAPENRYERITARVAAMPQDFGDARIERDAYLRRLDGLVFGDDPRQGFFRDGLFLHPELRFQLAFPEGWKTANQRQAVVAVSPAEDAMMQLTLVEAESAAGAARAFAGGQGVSASAPRRLTIHGLPAAMVDYTATLEGGQPVAGEAAFIEHGGAVYRILAYAVRARWGDYGGAVEAAIGSFQRLTDPDALAVEPWRLDIVELKQAMTLDAFVRRFPTPAPEETVGLINAAEPGTRFHAGQLVKRIVGGA